MRLWMALFVLMAGCLGPASTSENGPPPATERPHVDVLVTDTEWVPIDGAIVFIEGQPMSVTTDPFGHAKLPLPAQRFVLKAWAPLHYRSEQTAEPAGNETRVHIQLERRPDDVVAATRYEADGFCLLGVPVPGRPVPCVPSPQCFVQCSQPATVSVPLKPVLGESFHNMTVRVDWEAGPFTDALALVVRFNSNYTFANGSESFVVAGRSPIVFELTRADLHEHASLFARSLRIGATAPEDPALWNPSPIVFSQPFHVQAHIVEEFRHPPNPPW